MPSPNRPRLQNSQSEFCAFPRPGCPAARQARIRATPVLRRPPRAWHRPCASPLRDRHQPHWPQSFTARPSSNHHGLHDPFQVSSKYCSNAFWAVLTRARFLQLMTADACVATRSSANDFRSRDFEAWIANDLVQILGGAAVVCLLLLVQGQYQAMSVEANLRAAIDLRELEQRSCGVATNQGACGRAKAMDEDAMQLTEQLTRALGRRNRAGGVFVLIAAMLVAGYWIGRRISPVRS